MSVVVKSLGEDSDQAAVAECHRVFRCRYMRDPDNETAMRKHIGHHYHIQYKLLRDYGRDIAAWAQDVLGMVTAAEERVVVGFQCRSGRHRSVACAEMVGAWLQTRLQSSRHVVYIQHREQRHDWKRCRMRCRDCDVHVGVTPQNMDLLLAFIARR